jgi:hypothetical protein
MKTPYSKRISFPQLSLSFPRKRESISIFIIISFLLNTLGPIPLAQAQDIRLPVPGVMVHLSPPENPPVLKGVTVYPDDPFKFDFILDKGDNSNVITSPSSTVIPAKAGIQNQEQLKQESIKLVKYFLASITTPENDLWVNLSPYEKDRIIPESFGQTDMGRDLLAEDYILKQITASLIYPEEKVGKEFWKRVYAEAQKKFGTTNIPVNTFNKVWIVPDHAKVYEHGNTAFVVNGRLKVMLEQDYLALEKNQRQPGDMPSRLPSDAGLNTKAPQVNNVSTSEDVNTLGSQIVRQIIIPQLEKEVNEDKNFAPLRQVYYSLILAVWFKKRMKDTILGRKYMDQNKVAGIHYDHSVIQSPTRGHVPEGYVSPSTLPTSQLLNAKAPQGNNLTPNDDIEFIYQRYLKAFKKGVFNYIKEENIDTSLRGVEGDAAISQRTTIPRKYFSGGFAVPGDFAMHSVDYAQAITPEEAAVPDAAQVTVNLATAQLSNPDLAMSNAVVDKLAIQFWQKWYVQLNQLFAGRIRGWDAVGRKQKVENLARMTDDDIVIALSRLKMHFPRIEFPLLSDYQTTSPSLGFDINELQALIEHRDDDIGDYAYALYNVVSRTMIRTAEISRDFNHEYWKRVPEIVRRVIAANPDSTLHKGNIFRDVMSEAVMNVSGRLYGNTSNLTYPEAYNLIVKARRDVAIKLNQTSVLKAFDEQSVARRKGLGSELPVTEVSSSVSEGKYSDLYNKLIPFFAKHKLRADEFFKGIDSQGLKYEEVYIPIEDDFKFYDGFPEELKDYQQRIRFYPKLGQFKIYHGDSKYVPYVERHLETLWNKAVNKFTPIDERYKALAEFEWWSFQIIPMGRSGAAIGDAMSLIAQISANMPLRNEFRSLDFFALSQTSGEFINFRYDDFMANEDQRRIDALPEREGNSSATVQDIAMKTDNGITRRSFIEGATPGGIDLTAKRMDLEVEKDKAAVGQPMDLKVLENIEINGLYIKDIKIKPLNNLPELLGVSSS